MSLVCVLECVFVVAGYSFSIPYLVLSSGAVVRQVWWQQIPKALACRKKIFLLLWNLVWPDIKFWAQLTSLRMLYIGPSLFWLGRFLLRGLLLVWWVSLCRWPSRSLWLPLTVFLCFWPWRIWWLCVLGILFLWSILLVFSTFSEFKGWPV